MSAFITALREVRGYWYLCSPYSKYPDGIDPAFIEVCKAAWWLIEQGVPVYSPIAHTHPIAMHGGADPLDHNIWLPADKPLMEAAHGLLVCKMPTWDQSYGISKEIEEFREADKPIIYFEWPR